METFFFDFDIKEGRSLLKVLLAFFLALMLQYVFYISEESPVTKFLLSCLIIATFMAIILVVYFAFSLWYKGGFKF